MSILANAVVGTDVELVTPDGETLTGMVARIEPFAEDGIEYVLTVLYRGEDDYDVIALRTDHPVTVR